MIRLRLGELLRVALRLARTTGTREVTVVPVEEVEILEAQMQVQLVVRMAATEAEVMLEPDKVLPPGSLAKVQVNSTLVEEAVE